MILGLGRRVRTSLLTLILGALPLASAFGQLDNSEPIGTISVSDLLLAPRFSYSEPSRGHFQPGDSYVAFRWQRDEVLSATVVLGTQSLINIPNRYTQINGDTINIIEAYGQSDNSYGKFRFGLIPIPFGSEGGIAEGRLRFPRSLIFEKGIIGLRDHGVSYAIDYERFISEWAIHNGESGRDLDNQVWFTARWGYLSPGKMRLGVSGQAGRTRPLSTDPTGTYAGGATQSPDAIMDLTRHAKFRIANVFLHYDTRRFGFTLEGTTGDVIQESRRKFNAAHADVYVPITPRISTLARYDFFDPKRPGTPKNQYVSQHVTAGLSYRTGLDTSEIYLLGTQELKPDPISDVHRFMIMWKLTPQIFDRR